MKSIEPTIKRMSSGSSKAGLEGLRQAEFLRKENGGQATAEVALLLAESESKLLQTPHPDRETLSLLRELRLEAALDL